MRIAFSCEDNKGLDAVMSHHFGRCPFYTIVEVENNEAKQVEVIENPHFGNHSPGAVPGFINNQNVNVMIAGGMGARAVQFFNQFGIEAVTGGLGQVSSVLEQYLSGALKGASGCEQSHDHGH